MRDDFPTSIKEALAKRVNYRCSNPNCQRPTSGPHTEPDKTVNVGVAAHTTAASLRGPRYDALLSSKQRASTQNGIWLCQKCAKLIDSDAARYSLELLHEWKRIAEEKARCEIEGNTNKDQNSVDTSQIHIAVPNIYGLSYDDAREMLINAGWQPFMKHWSYSEEIDVKYGNGQVFWERGYHEINSSLGTGYAFCSFDFVDMYGNKLKVVTAGEEIPEENIRASVVRWSFEPEE